MIFSDNPKRLNEFYQKVFQGKTDWSGGDFFSYRVGDGHLVIGPHDKVSGMSSNPERIMINYYTDDVKGEFERVKSLGAKVIAEPYQPEEDPDSWVATLADPDGNYFQLTSWGEK